MISPELRAEIRRLFFAEHWKIGTIVTQLGVHRDTVDAAVESRRFANTRYHPTTSSLEPDKAFIQATLEKYPRPPATRLQEMLKTVAMRAPCTQCVATCVAFALCRRARLSFA